jgi:hypothetical protein
MDPLFADEGSSGAAGNFFPGFGEISEERG